MAKAKEFCESHGKLTQPLGMPTRKFGPAKAQQRPWAWACERATKPEKALSQLCVKGFWPGPAKAFGLQRP